MGKNKHIGGLGSGPKVEPVSTPKVVESTPSEAKVPVSKSGVSYGAVNSAEQFPEFQQTNMLTLDPQIHSYLEEKGFAVRFINWGQYRANTNMHRSQWRPYEFSTDVRMASTSWAGTIDAEGLIRRGDLVLAVRPQKMHDEHRSQIEALNKQYRQFEEKKASDFKDFARERGVKTEVTQGSARTTKV